MWMWDMWELCYGVDIELIIGLIILVSIIIGMSE